MTDPALASRIEYDARLVEDATMLAMSDHPEEAGFRRARNRIYEVGDTEQREKQFRAFHAEWFRRLDLGRPIQAALGEQPVLSHEVGLCCIVRAISAKDEGADLHDARGPDAGTGRSDKAILIRLRPGAFLDASILQGFLRHELMHIADILDPRFCYQPVLPKSEAGPTCDNLVRERYRVLWDTWIDGRLLRRGWATDQVRENRLLEFSAAFSICGEEAEEKFGEFFDSDLQTHADLVAFATVPAVSGAPLGAGPRARPCPLCRFPSFDLICDAQQLSKDAMEEIRLDFPEWRFDQGLCRQCADLYQTRRMSRAAEAALPRI